MRCSMVVVGEEEDAVKPVLMWSERSGRHGISSTLDIVYKLNGNYMDEDTETTSVQEDLVFQDQRSHPRRDQLKDDYYNDLNGNVFP